MNKVASRILRWAVALALAALAAFFALLLTASVFVKLPALPGPLSQVIAAVACSAAFVYVASAIAPSGRKVMVSLNVALLAVLVSVVTTWPYRTSGNAVPFVVGTVIGSVCVVCLYRIQYKPIARKIPPVVGQPVQAQPENQPPDGKSPAAGEPRLFGLSDGVLLALASAGAYALAFAYEAGFGSLYRIPPALISLNLTTGFVAAAAGASAVILSYQALSVLVNFVPRSFIPSGESDTRRFARFLTLMFLPTAYFTMTGLNPVIIFGCIAALCIVYSRKPAAFAVPSRTPTGILFEKISPKYLLTLALIAYLLLGAFMLGRYRALLEPQFIFDQDAKHYIMLRIYGDNIIAAPYTEKLPNLVVGSGLRFFKVGDKDTPEFQSRSGQTRLSIEGTHSNGNNSWTDWAYPYE